MKIICKDNFGRENRSEILIAENINPNYGKEIVKFLNDKYGGLESPDFFILEFDNYKLYEFKP